MNKRPGYMFRVTAVRSLHDAQPIVELSDRQIFETTALEGGVLEWTARPEPGTVFHVSFVRCLFPEADELRRIKNRGLVFLVTACAASFLVGFFLGA